MNMIPIAVVGVGKIAKDQHLPSITASDRFVLGGAVSPHPLDIGVPVCRSLSALKEQVPTLAAVSICTPPVERLALVQEAFSLGLDVMMEKPPAASLSEAELFPRLAEKAKRTLMLAWHSREAVAVEPLRLWLAGRTIKRLTITWREDVRVWHPGQDWIWSPGIGVFDPAINALSILTRIVSTPLMIDDAALHFPTNRDAPIASSITMSSNGASTIQADFSIDQKGPQTWEIAVGTDDGHALLSCGGSRLSLNGSDVDLPVTTEYTRLYHRFADLVDSNAIDADLTPFTLVTDAFLKGRRLSAGDFHW